MVRLLLESDYCLVPGTRVLTDDLRWVPIEMLRIGDPLYAINENREPHRQRKVCKTNVVNVSRRILDCVEIRMENGDVLTSSLEHPWLACDYSRGSVGESNSRGSYEWRVTGDLRPGRTRLYKAFDPWELDTSWGAGYLAGAFDGEGCVHVSRRMDKGRRAMDGRVPSTRAVNKHGIQRGVRVISVTPVGKRDVIGIETTSHTFVAEGYMTHNSQIEVRIAAHVSNCRGLIDLFLRGGDPHTETAAHIFGLSLDAAAEDRYRYPTKRLNFGVIYGITAEGLAADIEEHIADIAEESGGSDGMIVWSVDDCRRLIADWYRLYPEIKDFRMEQVAFARRYGYVRDMFGRIRFVPEVYCPIRSIQEAGARQAGNMPVQSAAQGIIKLAMARLFRERNERGWYARVRFLLQVHDSLLFDVDEGTLLECAPWVRSVMTGVVSLSVPLEVDLKAGHNWGEMKGLGVT